MLTFADMTLTSAGGAGSFKLERRASLLAVAVADDVAWRLAFRAGWDAGARHVTHDRDEAFDHSGATDRIAFIDGWEARDDFGG